MSRLAVVLHGAESTGKTTLGRRLAAHFDAPFVPEYGRLYCELHGTSFGAADLVCIMHGQIALTRAAQAVAERRASPMVIADTDPLMTAAWAMMSLGRRLPELDAFQATGDLYLLMADDIPWIDDGVRLHATATDRDRFAALARAELDRRGVRYVAIGGTADARFADALAAIASATGVDP
jgi:NadR type nicotinamide-nucleotide adenylyltransferase